MITLQIRQQFGLPQTLPLQLTETNSFQNVARDLNHRLCQGIQLAGGDARLFDKLLRKSETLTAILFTAEQQKQLAALPTGSALTVTARLADHSVPWELLRVGDEFFGDRFAVGRVVSDVDVSPDVSAAIPHSTVASVLVSAAWELVSANTERTIVERRLRQLSHDFPALVQMPSMPTGPLTLAMMRQTLEESGWLHFAGHATEVADQRVLRLQEALDRSTGISMVEQLTPADLQDLCRTPDAVFLNACGALQIPENEEGRPQMSLVSEFLRHGTQWLLGSIAPMLDSQTRCFTTEFYDAILTGCSVAEALRRARLEARRSLGPHNVLPLSYVLYGDPSTSPFSLAAPRKSSPRSDDALGTLTMRNERQRSGGLTGQVEFAARTELQDCIFPCPCSRCGHMIETRHGVGNSQAVQQGATVVCVDCHRACDTRRASASDGAGGVTKPQTLFRSVENPVASAATAKAGLPRTYSTHTANPQPVAQKPAFIAFQRHLEECLNRPTEWNDIQSGKTGTCMFRLCEPKPVADRRAALTSLDAGTRALESIWSAHYTVMDPTGRGLADIRLLVPEFTEHGSIAPVTTGVLKQLLAASDPTDLQASKVPLASQRAPDSQPAQMMFVCSLSGFDSALLRELTADADPLWYRPGLTIYLHDISGNQTYYRPTDLNAGRLAHLLQRQSTGRQFQQAVQWIETQLPLVTSLGRDEILRNLKCEIDAVEAAMRHVAAKNQLQIDDTEDFGLVLSERTLHQVDAVQSASDQGTFMGRVSAALRRPFQSGGKRTE